MNQPLVSVIIPSYNYEASLPQCLEAILNQTYKTIEVIVVDDHSTDDSYNVALSYNAVKVYQTPENGGVAKARNYGVTKAQGDVFFFVDADVVLNEHAIFNAMEILDEDNDHKIASVCGIYYPDPLVRDSLWEEFRSVQAYVWRKASLGEVSAGFFSLGAIRRTAYEHVGPFQSSLMQTEEIDYGQRLQAAGKIILTDEIMGKHDDDHLLFNMLKKFWRRSRDRVPFYFKRGKPMQGFELPSRLISTLLLGVACGTLLLSTVISNLLLVVLIALLGMLILERDIYGYALKKFGLIKFLGFYAWYLMFHFSAGLGVAAGLWKCVVSKDFRDMYNHWQNQEA